MKTARYLSPIFRPVKSFAGEFRAANFAMDGMGANLVYQDAIMKDPLFYKDSVLLGTGLEILKAAESVRNKAKKVRTPLMVYHGTLDQIVVYNIKLGMCLESRKVLQGCVRER